MTVNYDELKNLTTGEITAKIRSGEIVVPLKPNERQEFLNFASAEPDSPERGKLLKPEAPSPSQGTSPEEPINPPQPESNAPNKEVPSAPSPPGSEPWWKNLGYSSEEEAIEKHKVLSELAQKQKDQIDGLNARGGQMGRELQEAKRELDEIRSRVAEIDSAKGGSEDKTVRPKPPTRPKVSDFEDGLVDEGYIRAIEEYEEKRAQYEEQLEEFLENQFSSVEKKVEQKLTQASNRSVVEEVRRDAWGSLWEREIPEFQKKYQLSTTIPVRQISDAMAVRANTQATAGEKQIAEATIAALTKTDMENYTKVKDAVESRFDFLKGYPDPRYKTWEAALYDTGKFQSYNVAVPAKLTKQEEKQIRDQNFKTAAQVVDPVSGLRLASGDEGNSPEKGPDAERGRYRDLNKAYDSALSKGMAETKAFESSPEMQEYLRLRIKLTGGRLPPALKAKFKG